MIEPALDRLRIIVVEPAGARNVGSIARVMKNMGLHHLVLVNPQCDLEGAEARHMAVHAQDVLAAAQQVSSLPEALQGCHRAIATIGRSQPGTAPIEHPRVALPWLLESQPHQMSAALIFGREDRGLSNEELNYAQRLVAIPSNPDYPSLNLAQAVAICCYELAQANSQGSAAPQGRIQDVDRRDFKANQPFDPPAALEQLDAYMQHLEAILLDIGYLYPHTASSRMAKLRRLLNRTLPSETELALLRGMLSQIEWAVQRSAKPAED